MIIFLQLANLPSSRFTFSGRFQVFLYHSVGNITCFTRLFVNLKKVILENNAIFQKANDAAL